MTLVEFYESREDWEHITLIGCWIARCADNGEVPDYNTGWCAAPTVRRARTWWPKQPCKRGNDSCVKGCCS